MRIVQVLMMLQARAEGEVVPSHTFLPLLTANLPSLLLWPVSLERGFSDLPTKRFRSNADLHVVSLPA